MDKNYYEILQVHKNASPEMIDRAYKLLAKKYHPDLQPAEHKKASEEIFKKINEAYEVLSDPLKRENYNRTIVNTTVSSEKYDKLYQENLNLQNEIAQLKRNHIQNNNTTPNRQPENHYYENNINSSPSNPYANENKIRFEQELKSAREKAYHDAYIQDLRNRGYKIRFHKSLSSRLKDFLALAITIGIFFILFQIPFIKEWFLSIFDIFKIKS